MASLWLTAGLQAQYARAYNAGGGAIQSGAIQYLADQAYAPPQSPAGFVGGSVHVGSVHATVGGGEPVDLYRQMREGVKAYRFECPNGTYLVTLGFSELARTWANGPAEGPGLRAFSVDAEGRSALRRLDVAAEGGHDHALKIRFTATVADGRLDLEFTPIVGATLLGHVHVVQRTRDVKPPPPPTFVARAGFGRNILHWTPPADDDYAGVHVLRAPVGTNGFTTLFTSRVQPARYADFSAEAGKRYDYRLVAFDVYGNTSAATATASATARKIDAPGIRNYRLDIDPQVLRMLDADPWARIKMPATFSYAGVSIPVRVRYVGVASMAMAKKSWKIDFGRGGFDLRREVNLYASFAEHTFLRERLALDVFRAAGAPATRSRFAHLIVNGEERGLFVEVETLSEAFLEAAGRDRSGTIFKATDGTLGVLPGLEDYPFAYSQETNRDGDYRALVSFIQRLNLASSADFARAISEVLDVDAYLSFQAVLIWINSRDSVYVNYALVHHERLGRWEILPWDQDLCFGLVAYQPLQLDYQLPLDWGTKQRPSGTIYNRLTTRMLDVPLFRWKFASKLAALGDELLSFANVVGRVDAAFSEVRDVGRADLVKWGWEDNTHFDAGPASLKQFVLLRKQFLDQAIPAYKPAVGPRVVINEVMADNLATHKDEVGDFDDWFELYNPGPSPVSVSGMYVTDDLAKPTKWRVPSPTSIPAGGHLLIWADNEPLEGKLHAVFKLSASGEQVAVFDTDGKTLLDVVHFGRMREDTALARSKDGAAFFRLTASPTPAAANAIGGNMPPRVFGVLPTPSAPRAAEPVTVTAEVRDDHGLRAVSLHYRTTGGFAKVAMLDDGMHGDGAAGDAIHGARIPGFAALTTVEYYVEAEDAGGRSTFCPAGAPNDLESYRVVPAMKPGAIRIHEFVADNFTGIVDEKREREDWIELRNTSGVAVDVGGMFLTDDLNRPRRWLIPANTSIPAGQTLLIWADGETGDGKLHAGFSLSAGGEEIALFDKDGITLLDALVFGQQFRDSSTGRLDAPGAPLVVFPHPTPRSSNRPPSSGGYLTYLGLDAIAVPPLLQGVGVPVRGGTATLAITGAAPAATGFLVLSLTPTNSRIAGVGDLLVVPSGAFLGVLANPQGDFTLPLPIPQHPVVTGLRLFAQAGLHAGGGLRLTNGLMVLVGP